MPITYCVYQNSHDPAVTDRVKPVADAIVSTLLMGRSRGTAVSVPQPDRRLALVLLLARRYRALGKRVVVVYKDDMALMNATRSVVKRFGGHITTGQQPLGFISMAELKKLKSQDAVPYGVCDVLVLDNAKMVGVLQ